MIKETPVDESVLSELPTNLGSKELFIVEGRSIATTAACLPGNV
jgi:hypothetical protein